LVNEDKAYLKFTSIKGCEPKDTVEFSSSGNKNMKLFYQTQPSANVVSTTTFRAVNSSITAFTLPKGMLKILPFADSITCGRGSEPADTETTDGHFFKMMVATKPSSSLKPSSEDFRSIGKG
jgi:hypothetical protein